MSNGWMRNYTAMGDGKLLGCIEELAGGYGDAVNRVNGKGGSVPDNLAKARHVARSRGLITSSYTPVENTEAITEKKFCPACERQKPFLIDDYICRDCRQAEDAIPVQSAPEVPMSKEELLDKQEAQVTATKDEALTALDESLRKLTGENVPDVPKGGCTRDYSTLAQEELVDAVSELKAQEGSAYNRVVNTGESLTDHLIAAQSALIEAVTA